MSSDFKQEYLDAKYAYFDGETDAKPKKKSKKKPPKKANHKHEYTNVIIEFLRESLLRLSSPIVQFAAR